MGATAVNLLVNIDVPDLEAAIEFYRDAFGFVLARRLGLGVAELTGGPAPLYLMEKAAGSFGAGDDRRRYTRHWTPVHLDLVVDEIDLALARAVEAGATLESPVGVAAWGKFAVLADPFGHGFCLIQLLGRGYGELEGTG